MHEMIEPAAATSWDDLFADLGLPPEKPAALQRPRPPALEAAPAPAAAEQEPAEEAEAPPARSRRRRSPPAAAVDPEEEPTAAESTEAPAALAIESTDVSVPTEEPALEANAAEPSAVEGDEETPAPKGRSQRRRRGRGSKSATAKEKGPVEPGCEVPAEGLAISTVEASETAPPTTESDEESEQRHAVVVRAVAMRRKTKLRDRRERQ